MHDDVAERPIIELTPATLEQKPILGNLLELYSHDFSDFIDLEIGPDGRFGYGDLDIYWELPDIHYPFLVYADGRLAGFVFVDGVQRDSGDVVWDIAEFFILRGYRRRKIGTEVAHRVWQRFPGSWEVRVMVSNEPAYRFWRRAVRSFAGTAMSLKRIYHGGRERHLFGFESRPSQ